MSEYTPEKVAELIAEAREWPRDGVNEGPLINALADALTAVSAERDRLDESFDRDLPWRYSEVLEQVKTMRANRDRLHKAITEARKLNDRAQRDPDIWEDMERIFRAALDKEGNDDAK